MRAIINIDQERALDIVFKMADSANPDHRLSSVYMLKRLNTPETWAKIEKMAKDPDKAVSALALNMIPRKGK